MLVRIADLSGPEEVVRDFIDRASTISMLYDDSVEADQGDAHKRAPGIHASEISQCVRKVVYSIQGSEKQVRIAKAWRQRFQVGKAIHAMIQADMHAMARASGGKIRFEDEVAIGPAHQQIAEELNIHSSADGVFSFYDDPLGPVVLRVGLEIKTESPDGYAKLTEPKEEHLDQAHVYMKCLDLPLFYFMYINKGNQNNTPSIHPFLVKFDPNRWAALERRCRKALQMARDGVVPEREEGIHCSFCPYAHTCGPRIGGKGTTSASWKAPRRQV